MSSEKMRTFEFDGKKRGIRLDEATWKTIDWLADRRGVKWAELAILWADDASDSEDNLTRVIRTSALDELLRETIFQERAESYQTVSPIWESIGMCDEERYREIRNQAQSIEGSGDFGGFKLDAGVDEFGNVRFYIENNVKGWPNIVIGTPFTHAEWAERTEE